MNHSKAILFSVLLFLSGCFNEKAPETYLIPDGYQGNLLVVYEQQNGAAEEFEANRRLYRIDSNGILITKFKFKAGTLDQEYYYLKKDSSRQRIRMSYAMIEPDSTARKKYINKFSDSILIQSYGTAGSYGSPDLPKLVPFTVSTIGNNTFTDTTNFDQLQDKQWKLVFKKQ